MYSLRPPDANWPALPAAAGQRPGRGAPWVRVGEGDQSAAAPSRSARDDPVVAGGPCTRIGRPTRAAGLPRACPPC